MSRADLKENSDLEEAGRNSDLEETGMNIDLEEVGMNRWGLACRERRERRERTQGSSSFIITESAHQV